MDQISDSKLLEELKKRLSDNQKALNDLRAITKKLEAVNLKLKESEALKSNFLSNIRNEINNPLTSIMGLSEQIVTGVVKPEKAPEVSKMIFNEAFDLDFQLRNIFMAAELEAGDVILSVAKIDVYGFFERVIGYFANKLASKDLTIEFICDVEGCKENGASFVTDPEKLQIVFVNLLANAIEFSPSGNKILIKAQRDKDRLLISVEDRGVGIEKNLQKDIFDRFRQLSTGVTKNHKGHGLGLSIVKSLLDLMDGTIDLASAVGKGSTFTVSLKSSPDMDGASVFSEDGNEFIFDSDEEVSEGETQEF